MKRRDVLKGAGGIAAVGGTAALLTTSAGATASAEVTEMDSKTVTTDDGTVAWVAVGSQGSVTFDGLETPADTFDFDATLTITDSDGNAIEDADGHVLASGTDRPIEDGFGRPDGGGPSGTRGTLEWHVPNPGAEDDGPSWLIVRNQDLLDNPTEDTGDDYNVPDGAASYTYPDAVNADLLTVDEDGESETYTVKKEMTVTISDENEDTVTATATGEFALTVENLPMDATQTSSGDAAAGGDPNKTGE